MISSGDVRVNWSLVSKSGATLKAGDVVSVSGMGRLKSLQSAQLLTQA
uniref:RNA-binding S4 domain-containing protein n=1 Tax=Aegilops tauschii subsp. strangulata TaxID=200361 RepID=A0A453FEE8_AEGTS